MLLTFLGILSCSTGLYYVLGHLSLTVIEGANLRNVLNDTMAIDAHVAKILVVHSRVLYIKSSSLIPLEEMVNTICP